MKPVIMAFVRMNPPTAGHEKLVNLVLRLSNQFDAPYEIVLSHSQDKKKNPLPQDVKLKHTVRSFPGVEFTLASKEMPTFLHYAKQLSDDGFNHLIMVGGSDRVEEYAKKLNFYNGKEEKFHNFKKITVISSGERDPEEDGVVGISASKLREAAKCGNFQEFRTGVSSHLTLSQIIDLYEDLKKYQE